jgi:hypothetical protein
VSHAAARGVAGITVALQQGMALFWETKQAPKQTATKPTPLSPLAIALLLKLQTEAQRNSGPSKR